MSRRITVSLLTISLLGSLLGITLTGSIRADAAPVAPTVNSANGIEQLLDSGDVAAAETAYLDWANAWHEDDIALLAKVESAVLREKYQAGDKEAFVGLVQVDDPDALNTLREEKETLSSTQLAMCLRILGTFRDTKNLPFITKCASSSSAEVAEAAVMALGNYRGEEVYEQLRKLVAHADLQLSTTIVRMMVKVEGQGPVIQRYQYQTESKFTTMPERPYLMLAAAGSSAVWPQIKAMLDAQKAPFSLVALSVLDAMPVAEATPYVEAGLKGDESEQLAAMRSIALLPADKIESALIAMLTDTAKPLNVRLAAAQLLAQQNTADGASTLSKIALDKMADVTLRKAALADLVASNAGKNTSVRNVVTVLMKRNEESMQVAARIALLHYAKR